jgi:hypothetical protein
MYFGGTPRTERAGLLALHVLADGERDVEVPWT